MSLKERGVLKRRGQPIIRQSSCSRMTTDNISIDDNASSNQTSSLCEENLENINKTSGLLLPKLDYSIFVENPTLQTLLMYGENSNYIMTEDEMNHLQWELESILTIDSIRQNTIREELFTYYVAMYTHKLPTVKSSADKQILSVNTFHKIKVKFSRTCMKLRPKKFESTKFWFFVKSNLAYGKKKDFTWLKNKVKSYDFTKKQQDIQPLGEHYSKKWAKYELEMRKFQSPCSSSQGIEKLNEKISPDIVELVNGVNYSTHEGSSCVPIYQRIGAYIAEHSHTSEEDIQEHTLDSDDEGELQELTTVCKKFYAEQTAEKQLQELDLKGHYSKPMSSLLEVHPTLNKPEVCDEILNEIIKCKNSLIELEEMNKHKLNDLFEMCGIDYHVQHFIKTNIEELNMKIFNFIRQENGSVTKKQEDNELDTLLKLRSSYTKKIKSIVFEHLDKFSDSDDSENSDSENVSDEEFKSPKINVVTKTPNYDISIKQCVKTEDEYVTEDNITSDVIDKIMDSEKVGNDDIEYEQLVVNRKTIAKKIEKTMGEKKETEKADDSQNDTNYKS